MSDEDLLALIERLHIVAASHLEESWAGGAELEDGGHLDASLANDAAMAVNELLALRQILRVSTRLYERGAEPLH
jgi:hypothetical protein